jgi:multiple sugar transport system ATP-binding protein
LQADGVTVAEVEFKGISKSFGAGPVLSDVSLAIRDGEFVSLLGPSGCGKTTLLRILAGLEIQDAGEVLIAAREVSELAPKRRDVAMVFQSYALYPYMSVEENIALPLLMRRTSGMERLPLISALLPAARRKRREIAAEVRAVAESLGIADYLERRPAHLSGGQRQRVALARAMVRRPAAFLMDEPLSNLDAKMRVKARAEIADLHRRLGATFIYVTHDQTEAMTMSDRVAVMLDGRILQVDAPRELYANPRHVRVATFIGSPDINTFEARVREPGVVEISGRVWPLTVGAAPGSHVTLAVRPEAWLADTEPHPCHLAGVVRHIEHVGSDVFAHVETAAANARTIVRLSPSVGEHLGLGAQITLSVSVDRILAFAADGSRIPVLAAANCQVERGPLREVVNG